MSKKSKRKQEVKEQAGKRVNYSPFIIGAGAVALLLVLAVVLGGGRDVDIPGVEHLSSEGQTHIPQGQTASYRDDPPASGTHWPVTARAGVVYRQPVPTEALVHNLEHGNIVIYYDDSVLSESDMDTIENWARQYGGEWDGILAVPRDDPEHPLILTAWTKRLRLQGWTETAEQFIDAYRGRGPENPVR